MQQQLMIDACLASFAATAYTHEGADSASVPPQSPWNVISVVPEQFLNQTVFPSAGYPRLAAVRMRENIMELWLTTGDNWLVYDTNTGIWDEISSTPRDSEAKVHEIFVMSSGDIIGLNDWRGTVYSSTTETPLLSYFDEQSQTFVLNTESPQITRHDNSLASCTVPT